MGDLEETVGSSSLGVDNSFRDSFTIEVGQLIDKVEVRDDDRSVGASGD